VITDYTPEELEEFTEHAARLEFGGNMSREEAEAEARRIIRDKREAARVTDIEKARRLRSARYVARFTMPEPEHRRVYEEIETLVRENMKADPLWGYEPTQDAQAKAVEAYLDGHAHFVKGLGWAVYSGITGTFRVDIAEHILRYIIRLIARERWDLRYAENGRGKENTELISYARKAVTEPGIRQVLKLLEDPIADKAENYDSNPYLLNCRGVTYNLRTGEYSDSAPEYRHMKTAMCAPQEGPTPRFDKFMDEITCGDASMAAWIMRWFGYCLSGDVSTPWFANFHGNGRNGKGTLLHVMCQIMGDYARTIPEEVVSDKGRYSDTKHANAELFGIRCGVAPDVGEGRLNLANIKDITGGDPINAERKYHDPFTYRPIVKLTIATNHQLRLSETGPSVVGRFRYVPFKFSALGREDTGLEDALLREAPRILNRLIKEAVEYFKNPGPKGFPPCEIIDRETAEYIRGEDVIAEFLEERTMEEVGGMVRAADLYTSYRAWAEAGGQRRPMDKRRFGIRIGEKLERGHDRKGAFYFGIKIRGQYD
jgi:putative DNA primase/helicase